MSTKTMSYEPLNTCTPEDVYNIIMFAIEPELVTFSIDSTTEKYAAETAVQKTERAKRYSAAFAKAKAGMHTYYAYQKGQVLSIQRAVFGRAKSTEQKESEQLLVDLESQINS